MSATRRSWLVKSLRARFGTSSRAWRPAHGPIDQWQPVTLADPATRRVQAGLPLSLIVAGPFASIFAESLTLAEIVAAPSAPSVASLAESASASRVEMPRITAVILAAS